LQTASFVDFPILLTSGPPAQAGCSVSGTLHFSYWDLIGTRINAFNKLQQRLK